MRTKAFTLVETLFAFVFIAIVIMAFIASILASINYLRRAIELRTVSLVLQEQVSLMREMKFSDIEALGGTFSSDGLLPLDNGTGSISKSSHNGNPDILEITIAVDWTTFNGGSARKSIVTMMTNDGINKK